MAKKPRTRGIKKMNKEELKELGKYLWENDLTIEKMEDEDFEMLSFPIEDITTLKESESQLKEAIERSQEIKKLTPKEYTIKDLELEQPPLCCDKLMKARPNTQTMNLDEEMNEYICMECGGQIRIVLGQLDEEELDKYKELEDD
jgi:DNA-directed RNA polymerase subunit RPC12/RpoP